MTSAQRAVLWELGGLWLVSLLLIRAVVTVQAAGLPDWVLAAVPFLFIYMPVWWCRRRGVDSDPYRLAVPPFLELPPWREAESFALRVVTLVLIPWLVGYHLYQTVLFQHSAEMVTPRDLELLIPYHLFYVALPEEFFYRGYFQTRLDEVFPPRWRVFGATVGPGLVIASLFFAFGHSLVVVRWWHFATFFPGLLFGWARARTGHVLAGAMLHAWANVTVAILDSLYGVR